jgi:hypothetical protein
MKSLKTFSGNIMEWIRGKCFRTKTIIDKFNHETIAPDIDEAFSFFYKSIIADNLNIGLICEKHLNTLEEVCFKYLTNHHDTETTRKYFKNLRFIWSHYIRNEMFSEAECYMDRILFSIIEFERQKNISVHKGPIYYFLGGTHLMLGKTDSGFLLMHKSYDEDIRTGQPQPTPSLKFVSLNFQDPGQYFGFAVRAYADYLSRFFNSYRMAKVSYYNIEKFCSTFLLANPDSDIVFSFTHVIAKLFHFSRLPIQTIMSNFAGQYKLNLLFDLALIIENTLRLQHPDYQTRNLLFPELAENLAQSQNWNLTKGHLQGHLNQESTKDYTHCLESLLERQFKFKYKTSNVFLENDLGITYLIRNRGAHDLSSIKVITLRFDEILQSLFNILFLVAEEMYS